MGGHKAGRGEGEVLISTPVPGPGVARSPIPVGRATLRAPPGHFSLTRA